MIGGQLPPITTRPNESTKNMAVGGFTNPTGTYQIPTNIASQPSYFQNYNQSVAPFQPFVPPAQQTSPVVTAATTANATGPSFNTLMPTVGGARETKEYRNEAGQKMFIPFIDGKPIYPIPEGYSAYVEETEATPETQPTVQSTSVRQDTGDGGDSNVLSGTTQVRGIDNSIIDTNFTDSSPEGIKDSFGKMTESQRGLTVINSMESARGSNAFMRNLATGVISLVGGPLGMAAGAYDTGSRLMGGTGLNIGASQPDALNNIVNSYGYFEDDTDPDGTKQSYLESLSQAVYGKTYEEATEYLGVKPLFKKGYKNGEIDPTTGGTYSNGQSTNDDGTVSYSSGAAAGIGLSAMLSSGFAGGIKDAQRVSTKVGASPKNKARAQAYLDYIAKEEKTSGLIADKKAKEEKAKQELETKLATQRRQDKERAEVKAIQDNANRVQELKADNERRAKENALTFGDVTKGADIGTVSGTQNVKSGGDPSGGFSGSYDSPGGETSVSDSGYGDSSGSTGGMGDFNQGGLAGKKKTPKPKKMKRGGLASRK